MIRSKTQLSIERAQQADGPVEPSKIRTVVSLAQHFELSIAFMSKEIARYSSLEGKGKTREDMSKLMRLKVPWKTPEAAELKRTAMMNVDARLVKSVASKTTTATVLASAMFHVGCKAVAAGMNSPEHQTRCGQCREGRARGLGSAGDGDQQDQHSPQHCESKFCEVQNHLLQCLFCEVAKTTLSSAYASLEKYHSSRRRGHVSNHKTCARPSDTSNTLNANV